MCILWKAQDSWKDLKEIKRNDKFVRRTKQLRRTHSVARCLDVQRSQISRPRPSRPAAQPQQSNGTGPEVPQIRCVAHLQWPHRQGLDDVLEVVKMGGPQKWVDNYKIYIYIYIYTDKRKEGKKIVTSQTWTWKENHSDFAHGLDFSPEISSLCGLTRS